MAKIYSLVLELEPWNITRSLTTAHQCIVNPPCGDCTFTVAQRPEGTCDGSVVSDSTTLDCPPPCPDNPVGSPTPGVPIWYIKYLKAKLGPQCDVWASKFGGSIADYCNGLKIDGIFAPTFLSTCCYFPCFDLFIARGGAEDCVTQLDVNAIIAAGHPECQGAWEWLWRQWVTHGSTLTHIRCMGHDLPPLLYENRAFVTYQNLLLPPGSAPTGPSYCVTITLTSECETCPTA